MTYPEPQDPDKDPDKDPGVILSQKLASKYGHPSTYPVADDELVNGPFYRKPLFYVPLMALVLFIIAAIVIIKPFGPGKLSPPATPYYDEAVLTFPEGTTDWKVAPETQSHWGYYICEIGEKWHKCYPTFIESTPAK